jgi:membrane-associated protease RseP (regulator of RpoE activity)
MVWINIAWSFVNLLPMLPLDGGNIAVSLLQMYSPSPWKAVRHAAMLGMGTGGCFALWGMRTNDNFILIMGLLIAFNNLQSYRRSFN